AGMGSRYGGLKQLDQFGPNGETIIDYSLYDAINAGFGKVVFIIRDFFKEDFKKVFDQKLQGRIEVEYVCQDLLDIPGDYPVDPAREKPWGTGHAVWVARNAINEPFGVINADDYYGVSSYKVLHDFLVSQEEENNYSVVGYRLKNTLSDHGTVNRGVCTADENGDLVEVVECLKIKRNGDGRIDYESEGVDKKQNLEDSTLVSMNMWGFKPSYFPYSTDMFSEFLSERSSELKSEFLIPDIIDDMIKNDVRKIRVLDTDAEWFGVTYQEDKPIVIEKIKDLLDRGIYPTKLWV
ncbi:MAG TPA: sugar phosphate nucleotidyltransferase, partial [Saprospiraceae bacterium]|nr:sugar phosphate nucleotidyltransferase [Saprospiraceae bacterium]